MKDIKQRTKKRIKFFIQTRIDSRKPNLLDAFIFSLIRKAFSKFRKIQYGVTSNKQ